MYFLPHSLPKNSTLRRDAVWRSPTAINTAAHDSVLLSGLTTLDTFYAQCLCCLVNDLVFSIGHDLGGWQLSCFFRFSLPHLLQLRFHSEMLKKEILLCFRAIFVNDTTNLCS